MDDPMISIEDKKPEAVVIPNKKETKKRKIDSSFSSEKLFKKHNDIRF